MFNYDRLFVLFNDEGKVHGLYIKRDNAIADIPENKRFSPVQADIGSWTYGDGPKKWRLEQRKIRDSHGIQL